MTQRTARLLVVAGATLLLGCGGHAKRPAASLSAHERAVLDAYEEIRAGLATDDIRTVRNGGTALAAELKKEGGPGPTPGRLTEPANTLAEVKTLDTARRLFVPLSAALIPLASGVEGYYIMTSPTGRGADWIQRKTDVDNPYFGPVLHDSGSLKK